MNALAYSPVREATGIPSVSPAYRGIKMEWLWSERPLIIPVIPLRGGGGVSNDGCINPLFKFMQKWQTKLHRKTVGPKVHAFVSFTYLKLHQEAKETKYEIRSISEYYVTITRPAVWKRNTSHAVSNTKKSEVHRANIFCRKKLKRKWSWPSKTSFLQWPTFVMWYRCCHATK